MNAIYNRLNIALLLCLVWGLMACVEEFTPKMPIGANECLVVDGNIISDSTVIFSLSRTFSLSEEQNESEFADIKADLQVLGSDGSVYNAIPRDRGKFEVKIGTLDPEVLYHVEIQYAGDVYTSTPQAPLTTELVDSLSYAQEEDFGLISLSLFAHAAEEAYFVWNFEEVWELKSFFDPTHHYNFETKRVEAGLGNVWLRGWGRSVSPTTLVGTTGTNTDNKVIKTLHTLTASDLKLSQLYSMQVYQRRVSKGEYEYYECKAQNGNATGGLFGAQPSELPTNIVCSNPKKKVIGFVGVNMNVERMRIFIYNSDIKYEDNMRCAIVYPVDLGVVPIPTPEEMYNSGYLPLDDEAWSQNFCIDIRSLGASISDKPAYWPR